jgi:hypothetical protein
LEGKTSKIVNQPFSHEKVKREPDGSIINLKRQNKIKLANKS